MEQYLTGEYSDTFNQIESYALMNGDDSIDEILCDIIENLHEAQKNGEPPESIVGNNIEAFCKTLFEKPEPKQSLKTLIKAVSSAIVWITILDIISMDTSKNYISFSLIFIPLLALYVIAILLIDKYVLTPNIFKKNKNMMISQASVRIIGLIAMLVIIIACDERFAVNIPKLPYFIFMGGYSAIYLGVCLIRKILGRKNAQPKQPNDRQLKKALKREASEIQTLKIHVELFNSQNKRLRKKGKPELTKAEFMNRMKKRYTPKKQLIEKIAFVILVTGVIARAVVQIAADSGWAGTVFFSVLLCVLEYGAFRFCYGPYSSGEEMVRILKNCEQQNIDIFDYLDKVTGENSSEISVDEKKEC